MEAPPPRGLLGDEEGCEEREEGGNFFHIIYKSSLNLPSLNYEYFLFYFFIHKLFYRALF
jgi:hypothetical protein